MEITQRQGLGTCPNKADIVTAEMGNVLFSKNIHVFFGKIFSETIIRHFSISFRHFVNVKNSRIEYIFNHFYNYICINVLHKIKFLKVIQN